METGFIRLSRKFFDNEIWQAARAFSEAEAWIDLIQSARFDSTRTECSIGAYRPNIGRGQYPASNRFLAKKWGRSEGWVKHFLAKLKKHGMITVDNTQGINVITLTKYDQYNPPSDPPNDPLRDPLNALSDSDLQRLATHLLAHLTTHPVTNPTEQRPTYDPNNKKEEKLTTSVVSKKKSPASDRDAAKAATLHRKEEFYRSLIPFVGQYSKEMVREFFDYWSELNRTQTKMRYEQEKTWELGKRLATWARRENNFKNSNSNSNSNGQNRKTDTKHEANAYALNKFIEYTQQHAESVGRTEGTDQDADAVPATLHDPW